MSWRRLLMAWAAFLVLPLLLVAWFGLRIQGILAGQHLREKTRILRTLSRGVLYRLHPATIAKTEFAREHPAAATHLPYAGESGLFQYVDTPEQASRFPEFACLADVLKGAIPGEEDQHRIRNLLGWSLNLAGLKDFPGYPIRARYQDRESWLIWAPSGETPASNPLRIGMLLPPRPSEALAGELRRSPPPSDVSWTILDLRNASSPASPGFSPEETAWGLATLGKKNLDTRTATDSLQVVVTVDSDTGLLLKTPWQDRTIVWQKRAAGAVFLVLGLLTLPLFWLARRSSHLELRWKFLGLFLLLLGMASAFLGVFALEFFLDRSANREAEFVSNSRQVLLDFDAGVSDEFARFKRRLQAFTRISDLKKGRFSRALTNFQKMYQKKAFDFLEIWDWQSVSRIRLAEAVPDPGQDFSLSLVAERLIKESLGVPASSYLSPGKIITWSFLEAPESGYMTLFSNHGQLVRFGMDDSQNFSFVQLLGSPKTSVAALLIASSREGTLARKYFQKSLLVNRPYRIFVRSRIRRDWPVSPPGQEQVEEICELAARHGESQVDRVEHQGTSYLVQVIPGVVMTGFDLIAMVPDSSWRGDPGGNLATLAFGLLAMLMTGLACFSFLTRSVLQPVKAIDAGILAMRSGTGEVDIPVANQDELGRLALAFNRLGETLRDLKMARTLQESFLEPRPSQAPGLEVGRFTYRRALTGGDFLDYFPLPDGRFLWLIGQVPGTGVSAALLMAMVKSCLLLHLEDRKPMGDLLPDMKRTLQQIVHLDFLTLTLGILREDTMTGMVFVLGEMPCWRVTAGEISRPVQSPGKEAGPWAQEMTLRPGDAWIFLTGGVVRACAEAGKPGSEAGVESRLRSLARANPGQAALGWESGLNGILRGSEESGDLTVLVIGRADPGSSTPGALP